MSDFDAIKRLAPDSHRIQRAKHPNRQRHQSRNGAEDQFQQLLRERNQDSDASETLIATDAENGKRDDDPTKSDADGGLDSSRYARRAARARYPGEVGRNTDITA